VKKVKQPGDNISLKTKKSENPLVMEWINAQTNLMDSLRYLIENEISRHGVRNLQAFIPAERNLLGSAGSGSAMVGDVRSVPDPLVAERYEQGENNAGRPRSDEAYTEDETAADEAAEEEIAEEDIESWV
jgi:hypothetical protein